MTVRCPVIWCHQDRPGNRHLCGACEAELQRALGDVPWLTEQLDIVLAKQGSRRGGGRRFDLDDDPTPATLHIGPLPCDLRATEATQALRGELIGWVRVLLDGVPPAAGPLCEVCEHESCGRIAYTREPADHLPDITRWLLKRFDRLVMHPAAEEAVDGIVSTVRATIRLIDRPPVLWFAGPCTAAGCTADLYAKTDAPRVQCRKCGTSYDVVARRQWLLDAIEDALFHAAGAAHVLTCLGWPCSGERIRQWAHRGRLAPHGVDGQGRPVYRVGDVRELLVEAAQRREEKREKAG